MNAPYNHRNRYSGGVFDKIMPAVEKFKSNLMPVVPQATVVEGETGSPMAGPGQMPTWLPWAALGTAALVAGVMFTQARR